MTNDDFKQAALEYHRLSPPGKIKVAPTKPMLTQRDLALAYSPGVAYACEAIVEDPNAASELTARGRRLRLSALAPQTRRAGRENRLAAPGTRPGLS